MCIFAIQLTYTKITLNVVVNPRNRVCTDAVYFHSVRRNNMSYYQDYNNIIVLLYGTVLLTIAIVSLHVFVRFVC